MRPSSLVSKSNSAVRPCSRLVCPQPRLGITASGSCRPPGASEPDYRRWRWSLLGRGIATLWYAEACPTCNLRHSIRTVLPLFLQLAGDLLPPRPSCRINGFGCVGVDGGRRRGGTARSSSSPFCGRRRGCIGGAARGGRGCRRRSTGLTIGGLSVHAAVEKSERRLVGVQSRRFSTAQCLTRRNIRLCPDRRTYRSK